MTQTIYKIFLLILFGGVLLFPAIQLLETGGYLFYCNGLDESAYLQYDYSRVVSSLSGLARFGQYLVNQLHEVGLSAGWINLLFDLVTLSLLLLFLIKIFKLIGYSEKDAFLSTIILFGVPNLFLVANPIIREISYQIQFSDLIYWFTMPDRSGHPFLRSPEPQVSYLILCCNIFIALRFKSYWLAYLAVPFLYPFLAIPYLFTVISLHLKWLVKDMKFSNLIIPFVAFGLVGLLVAINSNLSVSDYVKSYMSYTHLPLISAMGTLSLLLKIILDKYTNFDPSLNYIAIILVLSNFVGVNVQAISGWLIQASNYEQYWGSIVISILFVLYLKMCSKFYKNIIALASLLLLATGLFYYYDYNMRIYRKIPWTNELVTLIKENPSMVAIDDVAVSSWLSMVFPKQPALLFTLIRSYKTLGDQNLKSYLCARESILADPSKGIHFRDVFFELDAAYATGHKNSPLYTNLRKTGQIPERELNIDASLCSSESLHLFLVNEYKH